MCKYIYIYTYIYSYNIYSSISYLFKCWHCLPIVLCCFLRFEYPSILIPPTKSAIRDRCKARERIKGTYYKVITRIVNIDVRYSKKPSNLCRKKYSDSLELTFGLSNRADKIHNCGVKNSFNLIMMIAIKQNAAVCKT